LRVARYHWQAGEIRHEELTMQGAIADGEMVMAPAGGHGLARRRLALLGAIAVVLFAVAFGVGSMVKSHTAKQASAASLVSTTPVAGSPHLPIVKVQAATVPGLRAPVHKAVKAPSTTPGGQSSVTSTTPQATQSTPQVTVTPPPVHTPVQTLTTPPVQTHTTPPVQTHTTQQQTTTSGGLSGGQS